MQNRPLKTLVNKIIAHLPNAKVDHEGVTRVGCEKSGRCVGAEISRAQRPQQKPNSGKNTLGGGRWPPCLYTRKAKCGGGEVSQDTLGQSNEVNLKSVLLPVTTGTCNKKYSNSLPRLTG